MDFIKKKNLVFWISFSGVLEKEVILTLAHLQGEKMPDENLHDNRG